jgi:predicted RNA-binding protein with PIN domain
MDRDILVDGYNVIKNNLMFQTLVGRNFAYARELLVRQLKNRYRHSVQRVTVVFDGDGNREQVTHDEHVRIIFSRCGESADSVIARLAAEAQLAGRSVEMYSDDEEVRTSVVEKGGGVKSTNQLTRSLTSAPRDMASRSLHRQEMRHVYGIDPLAKHKDDDCEPPSQKKRGKKKKKSSRRYR